MAEMFDAALADLLRRALRLVYDESNAPVRPTNVKTKILLLDPAFAESTYGFHRFSELLVAAESASVVCLRRDEQDFWVWPVDVESPPQRPTPPTRPGGSIRPDLWRAFVYISEHPRLLERSTGRAHILARTPAENEGEHEHAIRKRYGERPEDFVVITPIPIETQKAWAHAFAVACHDEGLRDRLLHALRTRSPLRDFGSVLATHPDTFARWRLVRKEHVAAAIEHWFEAHGIAKFVTPGPPSASTHQSASHASAGGSTERGISSRELVAFAIERMTDAELGELPIKLRYLNEWFASSGRKR